MIRYSGVYANTQWGKRGKSLKEFHDLKVIEEDLVNIRRKGWAEMIKKFCEVDPFFTCPISSGSLDNHFPTGIKRLVKQIIIWRGSIKGKRAKCGQAEK